MKYAMKSIVIHVVNESCKINSHTLIQTKRLMDVIFWLVVSSWTVFLEGHMQVMQEILLKFIIHMLTSVNVDVMVFSAEMK